MKRPINFLADSIEKLQIPELNFNQFASAANNQPTLNQLCQRALGFEVELLGVGLNPLGNKLIVSTQSITAASRIYAQESILLSTINEAQLLPRCQNLYVHCAPLSWQSRFTQGAKRQEPTTKVPSAVTELMRYVADNQHSDRLKQALHDLAETLNSKG